MHPRPRCLCLCVGLLVPALACSSDPCEEQPDSIFCANLDEAGDSSTDEDTGDTGGGGPECIPLNEDNLLTPSPIACLGTGNGWMVLDVFGSGVQPPQCVNWGGEAPNSPTTDDCVPLDITMLPADIPSPGACCTQAAKENEVITQCMNDCGFAACKLAVAKLREAANALPDPDAGYIEEQAQLRVRGDLFGFANMLETPQFMAYCANKVSMANGEVVEIDLGAGMSADNLLGHVNAASVFLQCQLDADEPFMMSEGSQTCDATPNIPAIEDDAGIGGIAVVGAVTMLAPEGSEAVPLSDIRYELREVVERNGTIQVHLQAFTADVADVSEAGFTFVEPRLRLAAPVSAVQVGDIVEFPVGSLRIEVSAQVMANGELLFMGERSAGVYLNTAPALAERTAEGGLAFVDARFEAGGRMFVLNTEAGVTTPR